MDAPRTALAGNDFVALVAGAMAPLEARGASQRCAGVDPTGCRSYDVVLWTTPRLSFLFQRDSETGTVTFKVGGDAEVEGDDGEAAPLVELVDPVSGWELLASFGLSSHASPFDVLLRDAVRIIGEHFDALFEGETSALARARAQAEASRLAEAARVDAIERAALLREEWIGGWRCRELARSEALDDLIGDAMPDGASSTVWLVMTPFGETVVATRERAVAWSEEWGRPQDQRGDDAESE